MTLVQDIAEAARSERNGKRHPHQRRIRKNVLHQAEILLCGAEAKIRNAASFEDLHGLVGKILGLVSGAGELYVYDVATRIGAAMGLEPHLVYLHAGSREGARHLGVQGTRVPLSVFPPEMWRLTPAQAEDFLCIYKAELATLCLCSDQRLSV